MTVACLLPVRNGEGDLPGWLASAARVADLVVALDDGSTDATAALLHESPLVQRVLANPVRPTAHGWHDGENRNRLLRALDDVRPDWVLWLDADDRLAPDDAAALRAFLAGDALPGLAYGFPYLRMWQEPGGPPRHDPVATAVWRLFSWEPGQRLTSLQNHNLPLPVGLPEACRVLTTVRIQHWGVADPERWAARQEKYRQATGPGERIPTDFGGLDGEGSAAWPAWQPRPAGLPVLAAEVGLDTGAWERAGS